MASIIRHGSKTAIGTTALPLTTLVTWAPEWTIKWVYVKASSVNSGIVYIWLAWVTAWGTEATDWYPLTANDWHYFEIDNISLLYVIASGAGNQVFFYVNY